MQNDSSHNAPLAQSSASTHATEDDASGGEAHVLAPDTDASGHPSGLPAEPNDQEAARIRQRLQRGLAALVGLVILSFVLSWLFRDWLTEVGHYLIGAYGARGVFTRSEERRVGKGKR